MSASFVLPTTFPLNALKTLGEIVAAKAIATRQAEFVKAALEILAYIAYVRYGDPDAPAVIGMTQDQARARAVEFVTATETFVNSEEAKALNLPEILALINALLPILKALFGI